MNRIPANDNGDFDPYHGAEVLPLRHSPHSES